jgi:16S rRNA G966 N2-methylase RsmD
MSCEASRPGSVVLGCFAGSGITGTATLEHGQQFLLVDSNLEAIAVMAARFQDVDGIEWIGFSPCSASLRVAALGTEDKAVLRSNLICV